MKRIALIAAAAFVLLSGIGGGAYLFFCVWSSFQGASARGQAKS
jgi:hypothetical protein